MTAIHPWSWRKAIAKAELKSTTKLVLYTLANYMNEHGDGCFPSIKTISEDASLSKRVVIEHLALAAAANFIEVYDAGLGKKNWRRNGYLPKYPTGLVAQKGVEIEVREGGVNNIPQDAGSGVEKECGYAESPQHIDEKETLEGGYAKLPPQGNQPKNEKEGGYFNTPLSGKVVTLAHEGGYFGRTKVVTESNPNTTIEENKEGEEARVLTHAREEPPQENRGIVLDKVYFISLEQRQRRGEQLDEGQREYLRLYEKAMQAGLPKPAAEEQKPSLPQKAEAIDVSLHTSPIYRQFLNRLQTKLGGAAFSSWFKRMQFLEIEGDILHVSVESRFTSDWIKNHFRDDVIAAAKHTWPEVIAVEIKINEAQA